MSQRIIDLNNNGVDSLCCGRYDEAIKFFRHAILYAKNSAESPHRHRDGHQTSPEFALFRSPLNIPESEFTSVKYHSNMFDVYQCGFYIPHLDHHQVADLNMIPVLTVVLLYNIGLAYQIAAITECCDNSESNLMEGLRYYKLALMTFKGQEESMPVNYFLLALGCLTNMGHIFCHFWDQREAKTCRELLDRMLESSGNVPLSPADEDFFYSSTLAYCSDRMQSPAPAA